MNIIPLTRLSYSVNEGFLILRLWRGFVWEYVVSAD